MRPKVLNLYKTPGWEDDPNCVYIGRAGKGRDGYFGNPYPKADDPIGEFGIYAMQRCGDDGEWRRRVRDLWGKKLMCFCAPKPCHGDKLAEICWDLNTVSWCDGSDHLNVYSRGHTWLGRALSNFYEQEIETPDGKFLSVEGYWYWLGATEHPKRDRLRGLSGFAAKEFGRKILSFPPSDSKEFRRKIRAAIWNKIESNSRLMEELRECQLPLRHYYDFKGKVVVPSKGVWVLRFLERCRDHLRENQA